jgi:hypothetical protein
MVTPLSSRKRVDVDVDVVVVVVVVVIVGVDYCRCRCRLLSVLLSTERGRYACMYVFGFETRRKK